MEDGAFAFDAAGGISMAIGVLIVISPWLALCYLVSWLAVKKGIAPRGIFWLSVVLSPLVGFCVVLALPKNEAIIDRMSADRGQQKRCPYCAEFVQAAAIVCKHCQRSLTAPTTDVVAVNYYYASNGQSEGPFSAADLREFLTAKIISRKTLVLKEGSADWTPLEHYRELVS